MVFRGVYTALVTPFFQGEVDYQSFQELLERQAKAGIDGFVIGGTTGESPTLSEVELERLFVLARKVLGSKKPLILGVGSNSTQKTIQNAKKAEALGADGVLVVVPYYNKPPQRGLLKHFLAVAEAVNLPVILYNVPSRTVTSLEVDTIAELSKHPRIVAIKEATGQIDFARKIKAACGDRLTLLSGDDGTYEEFLQVGGEGIVSVASHILPEAYLKGQIKSYKSLIDSLYKESNPIPIKMALHLLGWIRSPECRLPLVEAIEETRTLLQQQLKAYGLWETKN